jgi:hypothetical protein
MHKSTSSSSVQLTRKLMGSVTLLYEMYTEELVGIVVFTTVSTSSRHGSAQAIILIVSTILPRIDL